MRTIIQGGTIVNEGRVFDGSIVIEDEHIAQIFQGNTTPEAPYDEVVDASGCFVLPGVIDDHVHFREPGLTTKADIDSESRAAAAGGITTYFDMPNTVPQTTTLEALEEKFVLAAQKSHVNYSFFFGATNAILRFMISVSSQWVIMGSLAEAKIRSNASLRSTSILPVELPIKSLMPGIRWESS